MPDFHTDSAEPELIVTLEGRGALASLLGDESPLRETARQAVSRELDGLLDALGIPGRSTVRITADSKGVLRHGALLTLRLQDEALPYPDELPRSVYSYVAGVPMAPDVTGERVAAWLYDADDDALAEWVSLICLEAFRRRPSWLFGTAQAAAYARTLPDVDSEAHASWLQSVLAGVLDARISVADTQAVADVVRDGLAGDRAQPDVTEDLIEALRPDAIDVLLPGVYLRSLTTEDAGEGSDKFSMLRDGLFYEVGLRYPDFRFVVDDDLRPDSLAFRINHLTTLPRLGLSSGECLVNQVAEQLRVIGFEARPAVNPATGSTFAIADLRDKERLEADGLTTWTPFEYLVLVSAVELRLHGASYVHRSGVEESLGTLEQVYPALITAARQKYSIEQITRVFRALAREELSLRNMRGILERMLDYNVVVTDPARYVIFDDRLPVHDEPDRTWLDDPEHLAAFVRMGLKDYLSHKYTGGSDTLHVFLLDQEIEERLAEHVRNRVAVRLPEFADIVEAVRSELARVPMNVPIQTVMTTSEIRPLLRDILNPVFPRLKVVAYTELTAQLNVQPVARISLGA